MLFESASTVCTILPRTIVRSSWKFIANYAHSSVAARANGHVSEYAEAKEFEFELLSVKCLKWNGTRTSGVSSWFLFLVFISCPSTKRTFTSVSLGPRRIVQPNYMEMWGAKTLFTGRSPESPPSFDILHTLHTVASSSIASFSTYRQCKRSAVICLNRNDISAVVPFPWSPIQSYTAEQLFCLIVCTVPSTRYGLPMLSITAHHQTTAERIGKYEPE